MYTRSRIVLVASLGLLVMGCDPPCENYWTAVCKQCGAESTGCDLAKKRADKLKDAKTCEDTTTAMKVLVEEPGGKNVICSLPVGGGLPSKSMLGTWQCGSSTIALDLASLKVDDKSFEVVQLSDNFLNLKLSSSNQTSCNLFSDAGDLGISCATPVGSLPTARMTCHRPGK